MHLSIDQLPASVHACLGLTRQAAVAHNNTCLLASCRYWTHRDEKDQEKSLPLLRKVKHPIDRPIVIAIEHQHGQEKEAARRRVRI